MMCEYGCGREALYQFKNGKWCCSYFLTQCPSIREKNSKANNKNKASLKKIIKLNYLDPNILCSNGCGQVATYQLKNRKFYCCENPMRKCPTVKMHRSMGQKGRRWKHKIETILKMSADRKGRIPWNKGLTKENSLGMKKNSESNKKTWNNNPELKEALSKRMRDGQAIDMIKKIKNPSNEEIKLRNLVFELFSCAEHSYKILNYCLDIVLPILNIAIEFDGYYHFNNEDSIKYFKHRKKLIEDEGWIIISYTKIPTKEKCLNDILEKINENYI